MLLMFFDPLRADVWYAVRTLLARRLFTVVAVSCLSLGIATSTTVFSVFDRATAVRGRGRLRATSA